MQLDLRSLKHYLQERKIVPLQDMAFHFRVEKETLRPLLEIWMRKGKVYRVHGQAPPCKGCCQCDPATIETYAWKA